MNYEPVIGLEIHVELKTRTKMFCSCKNDADEKHPNVNVCPICLGHPGTLPAMNREAVRIVQRVGAALNCELADFSKFDRKNYFYPDLPKGYQISQYDMPLCIGGYLDIYTRNNTEPNTEQHRRIRIRRIHLEEDAGRLLHPEGAAESLVDFNRAGMPLMELVTEPDIRSAEEARAFAEELRLILRYLGASDANMEKGQMRVEVNISLSNPSRMSSNGSRIMLKSESYRLMKLLFEVHNKLGPIYKEKNYQDAIEEVLKRENIPYEREKLIALKFENLQVSNFFADFFVDGKILLEVKAKPWITLDDVRQASRYIKSLNAPLAIVVNFKKQKLEYKRVVNPAFENDSSLFEDDSRKVLGTKVEIKNLNSLKSVEKAVQYETQRQSELLYSGQKVVQETRGWHDTKQITFSQRSKEEAHDYRYFPEPDLPPMRFSQDDFDEIRASIPELPQARRIRFAQEYGLVEKEIAVLISEKGLGEYFEQVASDLHAWCQSDTCPSNISWQELPKAAANWLLSDFWGLFQERSGNFAELAITPENFAEFVKLVLQDKVSSKAAKEILVVMYETGQDPSDIMEERGLGQVSDTSFIEEAVKKVIEENPKAIADYKAGKQNAIQFLAGKVMAATRGKANPNMVREALGKHLTR